jgi:antitoxin (DNA-binding transcriptional repressor) of toxin-antitoxin stability system
MQLEELDLIHNSSMPSMTLSQLRNTRQVLAWLKAGETIELRYRDRVIGHIVPVSPWPLPEEDGSPEAEGSR